MNRSFETSHPVRLQLEIGAGQVQLTAADTTQATVEVTGHHSEDVVVELDGDTLSVLAPRQRAGFLGGEPRLRVDATVPTDSRLWARVGSADVRADGRWGTTQVKSGSGNLWLDVISAAAVAETGSGDVHVAVVADELRIKSGSGDVRVESAEGAVSVSTGSGDVLIDQAQGPTSVKTGSGDLRIALTRGDVAMSTASGDTLVERLSRGRFTLKAASGDATVGVPPGVPVWTDISSVSGRIHSDLDGAGHPAEGQDHIELRAATVSGDVTLRQL